MEEHLSTMPQPRLLFNTFTAAPAEIVLITDEQHQTHVEVLIDMHLFRGSDGWLSFDREMEKMRSYFERPDTTRDASCHGGTF